jgi:hypothetical protein
MVILGTGAGFGDGFAFAPLDSTATMQITASRIMTPPGVVEAFSKFG